jgi:hypothetical protein
MDVSQFVPASRTPRRTFRLDDHQVNSAQRVTRRTAATTRGHLMWAQAPSITST